MLYDVYGRGGFKVKCAFFCPSRSSGICVLLLLFSQFFSLKNSKKRLLLTYLVVEGFFFVFLTALVFHLYIPFLFILCMLHYFHHSCTFVLLHSAFDWKNYLFLFYIFCFSQLQEKVSYALCQWITSVRGRCIINLSLSLTCVSLVSADLLKNLWTGAWISINHFNWNKQCLINRIFLSSIEQNDNDENKNTVST